MSKPLSRRQFIAATATTLAAAQFSVHAEDIKPTEFQLACMTLPYSQFPLARALKGIKAAGYKHVAWGTNHRETPGGKRIPVMAIDAPTAKAKELGNRCRDLGLSPLMMFSTIYPEHKDGLKVLMHRLKQAAAAGIPQVLTNNPDPTKARMWLN